MTFLQIDPSLEDVIYQGSEPVRIKIIFSSTTGMQIPIEHSSIETAFCYSSIEQTGIIISTAEITFSTETLIITGEEIEEAKIYLSCGNNSSYLHRFTMYPDDSSIQEINSGGSKTRYRIKLEDIPARLKRLEAAKDWSTPQTVIDATISDKEHPESSIFHIIAGKAGIESEETDSCTITLTTPYVVIDRDAWRDLTDLANTFKSVIEGGTEKKLILSYSRYQQEDPVAEDIPELNEQLFYRVDEQKAGELIKNEIRLRWNKPERLGIQTLWNYNEPPVTYDANLIKSYPFSFAGEKRRIEQDPPVESPYTATFDGKIASTVYADEIDSQAAVEARMQSQSGGVCIESYDIETHKDRATIKLSCNADDEIKDLRIEGRPIVMHQNCSCYKRDEEAIAEHSLKVLNVTGRYFLDTDWNGKPQYEDWVDSTLEILKKKRKRYTLYTQYCIFFIRAGAMTYFNRLDGQRLFCKITRVEMSYTKKDGFEIKTELTEEG